ncbi:hypothetical protein BV25DRAFT_1921634 [Artomyces pyxidatus]|uniref:Uncharacterized protein n=1 Tax=Artomyces pyxidatus TaxID=48021 RepID=A0ACB8SGI7_9AGAM|nr:hypothetical protein BV25DRAFT_1921634 [Artomyces pyxidatus]
MTQTQPSEPEYIQLPTWTDHHIPGVDTYYGLSNTMFRGVYTSWSVVGPIVHGIPGAECVRYHTYEEAFEAITAAQEVRDLLARMQHASIDPMGPPTTLPPFQAPSPAIAALDGPTESFTSDASQAMTSQVPPLQVPPSPVPPPQVPPPPPHIPRGSRPRGGWAVFAVAVGRQRGIFQTAEEMVEMTTGYPNNSGRGFRTQEEAVEWLEAHPA